MGWLEGLVSGYSGRAHEIEKRKMDEAVAANQLQGQLFQQLLNSPDPQIKAMAATGMLQAGMPRKKQSGLQGWMGEVQGNPIYSVLQKYLSTPQTRVEDITHTTTPQQAGYLPTLPPTSQPAAQVNAQTTTPGTPGPATTQPLPKPTGMTGTLPDVATPPPALKAYSTHVEPEVEEAGPPPPLPGGSLSTHDEPELAGALASPPPSIAETQGVSDVARMGLGGRELQPEPLVTHEKRTITELPHAFPTAEDNAIAAARARIVGDVQGLAAMFKMGNPNLSDQQASQLATEQYMREHAKNSRLQKGDIVPDPTSSTGWSRIWKDPNTGETIDKDDAPAPGSLSARAPQPRELIAMTRYGKQGDDPKGILSRLAPSQVAWVLEEERHQAATRAAEIKLREAEAMADAPLARTARNALTEELNTKWNTLQKPVRDMQRALNLMHQSVQNYSMSPIGASQGVLVTFQKMLDPTSVVRESEYDRSPEGLSILSRVQGFWDRYIGSWDPKANGGQGAWIAGGAGVPLADLQAMADLADQYLVGLGNYNAVEQQRITDQANENKIDPGLIFGGGLRNPRVNPNPADPNANPNPGNGGGVNLDTPYVWDPTTNSYKRASP